MQQSERYRSGPVFLPAMFLPANYANERESRNGKKAKECENKNDLTELFNWIPPLCPVSLLLCYIRVHSRYSRVVLLRHPTRSLQLAKVLPKFEVSAYENVIESSVVTSARGARMFENG